MTTIDFGQLMKEAGEGFQPVPIGPYLVEVAKTEPTTTSAETGRKPMVKLQCRIIGGPHEGRILFDQFVLSAGSPNALVFFFEKMAALGLDATFFAANPPWPTVAQAMVGRQAMVTVGIKTEGQYAGRNEITKYAPPPAMGQFAAGMPQMGVPAMPQGAVGAMPPAPFPPQAPATAPVPVPPPVPAAAPVPAAPPQQIPIPVAQAQPYQPAMVIPPPPGVAQTPPPMPVAPPPPAVPQPPMPPAPPQVPAPPVAPQPPAVPQPPQMPVAPPVAAGPEPQAPVYPAQPAYNPADEEPFS